MFGHIVVLYCAVVKGAAAVKRLILSCSRGMGLLGCLQFSGRLYVLDDL